MVAKKQHASARQNASLEELVLQGHFRLRLETDARTEDIGQSVALLAQSVDHRSARWSQGSLFVIILAH